MRLIFMVFSLLFLPALPAASQWERRRPATELPVMIIPQSAAAAALLRALCGQ